jgi:multiple sugar transport system permease protein
VRQPEPAPDRDAGGSPRLSLRRLTRTDQRVLTVGIGIIVAIELALVWVPALASVALSFTRWDGIGAIEPGDIVGLRNYELLVSAYPRFWSAVLNNGLWLAALLCIAVPAGLALAVVLERGIRGGRFYQGAIYLPVLLSLALIGFIWELQLSPGNGLLNGILGRTAAGNQIDWLGDRAINRLIILVPAIWRHVGYVMVLYLAGLRMVDPQLREAALIDGAGERQAFFSVVLPALGPVTVVVLIVTAIQALRAFDIVYVLNGGLNGLEVLSVLITTNVLGEASRLGFGSAIATVLLVAALVPIAGFLRHVEREPAA